MRHRLIILLFCLVSCQYFGKNVEKEAEPNLEKTIVKEQEQEPGLEQKIAFLSSYNKVFSNEMILRFVEKNDEGFFIKEDYLPSRDSINLDLLNAKKSEHSPENWYYNISDKKYFPLYHYKKNNFYIIGTLVEYFGENDIPGVFFQLHTLDSYGEQLDYLIVFNRFSFELLLKENFLIDDSFDNIIVNSIEEDWLILDENNGIVGVKDKPDIKEKNRKFSLSNKGLFVEQN